jgi:hypothetical protein
MITKESRKEYRSTRIGVEECPRRPGLTHRLQWLLPALCLLMVIAFCLRPTAATDLWWQLKTGEIIWTNHHVPQRDVFSHTSTGQPWAIQEWLTELLFFALYRGFSADALVAYKLVASALAFSLVFWHCLLRSRRLALSAAVTALAVLTAGPWLDMRPQLFTYLLLALSLLILEQWRRGNWPRAIWLLPGITLLWVNLHGGFMLMFAVLAVEVAIAGYEQIAGVGTAGRTARLIAVAILCALCGLISPNGMGSYRYAFLLLGHHDMLNFVVEWLSPDFHNVIEKPLGYLLLLLGLSGAVGRRNHPRDLLILLGLLHSALFSHRHVPLLAIASAPIMAEGLGQHLDAIQRMMAGRSRRYGVFSAAIALVLGVVMARSLTSQFADINLCPAIASSLRGEPRGSWFARCADVASFPTRAVAFLASQPDGGRLFNAYGWGGYCDMQLWPKYRVFIDGRAEVFFRTSYWDYQKIWQVEPGWQARLRHWGVDTVLVPADAWLAKALSEQSDWRQTYRDDGAVVYRRVGA